MLGNQPFYRVRAVRYHYGNVEKRRLHKPVAALAEVQIRNRDKFERVIAKSVRIKGKVFAGF